MKTASGRERDHDDDHHPHRWVEEHPGVGFMVVSGAFEVFAGALLLFAGAPGGWACFVIGCGVTVMSGAALLAFDIEIEPGMATLVAVTVVVGLFAMTSLYFTHRAEDLLDSSPDTTATLNNCAPCMASRAHLSLALAAWRTSARHPDVQALR